MRWTPPRMMRALRRRWRLYRQRGLVVLGSSSSEAFDYVMGRNPAYHPFWASGWSARGLRAPKMQAYIRAIMDPLPRSTHVLLNFGVTDVVFNLRHKIQRDGGCDLDAFLAEAVEGILLTAENLRAAGFASVHGCFIAPLVPLPDSFWQRERRDLPPLPDAVTGPLYHEIYRRVAERLPCISTFDEMSLGEAGHYMLRPAYLRQRPNHHPSYIPMQRLLRRKLAPLPHLTAFRSTPLHRHYRHKRFTITDLVAEGRTRPRTCR